MAYKAGVLHRDVSFGNVMIARDSPFKGFLDNFDCSSLIDRSADGGTALTEMEKDAPLSCTSGHISFPFY